MRVFLGITGASGAPYAARVLRGLVDAGAEVGLCVSEAGKQVIGWELYRERELSGDAAVGRFLGDHGGPSVTAYGELDWFSPYASGSARCDAYIVCPCSMATCGTIASSGQANLIHRAAGVALKEDRRLILVPRETPLSVIHLEALLTLRRAGALVAPAMPEFYSHPDTLEDAVAGFAGRILDLAGVEHAAGRRWGSSQPATRDPT